MDSRLRDYCSSRLGELHLDRVFSSLYDEVHIFATQWGRTHNGGDCTTTDTHMLLSMTLATI